LSAIRWLWVVLAATSLYVPYTLVTAWAQTPPVPSRINTIILLVLVVGVLLSGNAVCANRRAERERQRAIADAPTAIMRSVSLHRGVEADVLDMVERLNHKLTGSTD
jgi:hypothetical protein